MTGVIAQIPKFQFSGASGAPLVNGSLTVYLAGTMTLTDTWQDYALTIANTNPVALDSRGECILWLDSSKSYKFVLSNSGGAVQWTQDNISSTLAKLAAADGGGLIGYTPSFSGALASTVTLAHDRLVNLASFLDPGDTDATQAFLNATAASKLQDVPLLIEGGSYLITESISFSRGFITSGAVTISGPTLTVGAVPPILINISRRMSVEGVTFKNMQVSCVPHDGGQSITPMSFTRNNFSNAALILGQTDQGTTGYAISENVFVCDLGRVVDGISARNCASISIKGNEFRSYRYAVKVTGTIGFSQSGIRVSDNIMERINCGVGLLGKSYCRVSGAHIINNSITQDRRDSATATAAIELDWCNRITVDRNTVSGPEIALQARSCINLSIDGNNLHHIVGLLTTVSATVLLAGCHNAKLVNNRITQSSGGAYAILVGVANGVVPLLAGGFYGSGDITIRNNEIRGVDRGVKLEGTKSIKFLENRLTSTEALNAISGLLWFAGSSTGYYFGNEYLGVSGAPVNNASGGGVVALAPAEVLTVTAAPAAVVVAPVITAADAAVNSAKSYVVTFTLNNVTALRQLCDELNPKKLSDWVATIAVAPTLAWNTAPWNSGGDQLVKDLVVNGGLHSRSGAEEYIGTRSALVIDRYGYLTCRDFYAPIVTDGAPVLCPTTAIEEDAWQTVSFRPPLVIDGAVYDPRISGLMGNTTLAAGSYNIIDATTGVQIPFAGGEIDTWSQRISGRTALGQKADGTFVLLIVDGKTNNYGCSKKQMSAKLVTLGCMNAYNLDGGGSTTLWYSGAVINTPSDGAERVIAAIMHV